MGWKPLLRGPLVAGADRPAGIPGDEHIPARADGHRHRADRPMADLERRSEASTRPAQAHEHGIVVRPAVLEVGDRRVPVGIGGEHGTVEARAVGHRALRAEAAAGGAEGDGQPRAPDVGRADRAVGQRDGPRLRVGLDGDGARRRAALGAERGRAGRARRQAPSGPCGGARAVLPRPPRQGRAVAGGRDVDGVDEEMWGGHVPGRRPRRVGHSRRRNGQGQQPGERDKASNHGLATVRRGKELRAGTVASS